MILTFVCSIALFAFPSSVISQAAGSPPVGAGSPAAGVEDEGKNNVPFCFRPPDGEKAVSQTEETCKGLFEEVLTKFDGRKNVTEYWTGDNKKRHEPNTIHLPKIYFKINEDQTQVCELELTDPTLVGDHYTPESVVEAALKIMDYCFSHELCGEITLAPTYTTSLSLCASIHEEPSVLYNTRLVDPQLMPGACPVPQVIPIRVE